MEVLCFKKPLSTAKAIEAIQACNMTPASEEELALFQKEWDGTGNSIAALGSIKDGLVPVLVECMGNVRIEHLRSDIDWGPGYRYLAVR